jgi:hypothetical protein
MTKLLLALVVVGALAVFNPSMDDFETFVEQRTEERIQERTGEGALGDALAGAGSRLLGANVGAVTERTSYVVCSVYHVDTDSDGADEWRFLGIADQFVEVQAPE